MNNNSITGVRTIVNGITNQTTVADIAASATKGDIKAAALSTASLVESMASAMKKGSPIAGSLLSLTSLANNLGNIAKDATTNGTIQESDILSAASDLTGLIGSGMLTAGAIAAGTAGAVPLFVGVGATLVLNSAVLTLAAINADGDVINTPAIQEMWDAVTTFFDDAGQTMTSLVDAMLSPDFWDAFTEHGEALFEPLFNPLSDIDSWLGRNLYDWINPDVNTNFDAAQNWRPSSPIALDLDGDGLETTAIGEWDAVRFDHNNNGVNTGTGWINPDDGLLVLDRNGNGNIDSGRELFGDNTQLPDGSLATDGYAALAQLDSNSDGKIDINDARFADLNIWRDLNQDGISQTNELFTLNELGVASISTQYEQTNRAQNGNEIRFEGEYTRQDGTTDATGDVFFNTSNFFTEFTNPIDIPVTHQGLPNMHGSGAVRNLREAATISGPLATLLENYSKAATRAEQMAMLDALLMTWSSTSGMKVAA